jgi:hypothetical protein
MTNINLTVYAHPVARALEAVRDAIVDAAERKAFADVEQLAIVASTLARMEVHSVDQVPPMRHDTNAGGNPLVDGDIGNLFREAIILIQSQATAQTNRSAIDQKRDARLDLLRELEMLQGIVNSTPEDKPIDPRMKARIEVLLSRLEVQNNDDDMVSADVLRGHSSDSERFVDSNRVGESESNGAPGAGDSSA